MTPLVNAVSQHASRTRDGTHVAMSSEPDEGDVQPIELTLAV
jgi:hypothetical protein